MLKWYGYLGILLIAFAELNFYFVIEPFATWYIPIVWAGYILLIDSIVYRIKGSSLIASYTREFVLMCVLSIPFWLIFEAYNLFTNSWIYINYVWYVHIVDFATIMPAVLETFTLISVIGLFKGLDSTRPARKAAARGRYSIIVKLMVLLGAFVVVLPFLAPQIGYPFMWIGLLLFFDPLNYLTGKPSVTQKVASGKKSVLYSLFLSGLIMGFFWEFWNYQALPKWIYNLPYVIFYNIKIFEMPLFGYLGYLPFAVEVYLFYAFFRSFVFKKKENALLGM
jgi:hypothetical protein